MKKYLLYILLCPLYFILTSYDEASIGYTNKWISMPEHPDWKLFEISTTEGSAEYIISPDGKTVSLYSADCSARSGYRVQTPPMDKIKDPDGIVHEVNAIGNPWGELQQMCIYIMLPSNIRYIYDNSDILKCHVPHGRGVGLEDNHEFDYLGTNTCITRYNKTIRIADNGTIKGPQWLYLCKTLDLGLNVMLPSIENYFFHVAEIYKIPALSYSGTLIYLDHEDNCKPHNIICRDANPPVVQGPDGEAVEIFSDEMGYQSDYAILYVPRQSVDTYRAHPIWGKFAEIRAIEDGIDYSSVIESIDDDFNVPTEWYTLQGYRLNERPSRPGIYIERCGNKSHKIAIR
ncbi:hypothetical protein [Muribaculum intestinale]|uniref:hypothetical protein n=1 Tax=Muribaculum intestinale TaxID=1796646 RepID=UPI002432E3C4|nr:hypothetical protein [Muribaculum intestinale]